MNIDKIVTILAKETATYKVPVVDLINIQTHDPYRVLVATILSARTRDEVTAKASAKLFKKAPDLNGLAKLSEEQLAKLIHPVGFFRTKAKHLTKLPAMINDTFGGTIPDRLEDLIKLPGVGRKTANLVVSVAFDKPAICVDTHVHRIMNIWGYVDTKNPLETEMALRQKLPKKHWKKINSILVAFGQRTCRPISPHCDICIIKKECPQIGITPRKIRRKSKTNEAKTFLSWNVNGVRAIEKKGFVDLLQDLAPDILGIQEIKAQPDQLSEALKNIPGYHSYWFPAERKGYSGVGVYAREKPSQVYYGIGSPEFDCEGRVISLEYDDFYFVNTYFPNAQHELARIDYKLNFNDALLKYVDTLAKEKSVVLCGDFNVAHKAIDLKNPDSNVKNPGFSPQERAWMDEFIGRGYIDTFRKFDSGPDNYSWWSYRFNARARNIGWRIDYFCVDPKSEKRVKSASILKDIMGSDHCPVQIEFL